MSYGQGDCPAQYMCVGGSFTAVTDAVDELSSSNNGCLAVNEGTTSYWVQICALTAGTIQFEIAPSGNNNDYDWAVWNGSACPPTVAPIRCSFAISVAGPGADNTGVNSTNNAPQTDNSEGAGGNQWTQDINAVAGQCFTICINNYGPGSNNFNLTFGGTATLNCSILPIELLYFVGVKEQDGRNLLKWVTASEMSNDYFSIERSDDGEMFEEINRVDGAGNSSSELSYYVYDNNPIKGYNYYRLKQVDYNGDFEYSKTIVIDRSILNEKPIKIINYLGQEVDENYEGLRILYYEDGTAIKKVGK
ncbi:MAG: hypothetical protein AABY15_01690 [Nanoarchaeota archaeon]